MGSNCTIQYDPAQVMAQLQDMAWVMLGRNLGSSTLAQFGKDNQTELLCNPVALDYDVPLLSTGCSTLGYFICEMTLYCLISIQMRSRYLRNCF